MIDSVKTVLDKLDFRLNSNDQSFAKFFDENGYCVILKSDLVSENIVNNCISFRKFGTYCLEFH